jgi:hypothetical protein
MSILFAAALIATLAAGLLGRRDHYTSPRSNDFTLRTCLMSPVIKREKKKLEKRKWSRSRRFNGWHASSRNWGPLEKSKIHVCRAAPSGFLN